MSFEKDLQEKRCIYVIAKSIFVYAVIGIIGFGIMYAIDRLGGRDTSIDYDSKCKQSGPHATVC
jgi:hypothetical protein